MREYSKITPQFWLGSTGKKLRGHHEAQIVALYLLTTPHANMLGLYYLPKMFIAHETGLPFEGACKGLARCIEVGFCHYDDDAESVWVIEMALHQVGELKSTDNRCVGIQNEYDKLPDNLYLQGFHEKYASIFHMKKSRGYKAPCKPLRSQEQEQEQELNKKNNASEEKSEQEIIDKLTNGQFAKPDKFKMHLEWAYSKNFELTCKFAGRDITKLTDDVLRDFIVYHEAKENYKNQKEWESALLSWLTNHINKPKKQGDAKPFATEEPKYKPPIGFQGYPVSQPTPEEKEEQKAFIKKWREDNHK